MSVATFSITTLGCKVNQYDSSALVGALVAAGLTPAKTEVPLLAKPPELVVINTCCVTATAMQKSRNAIRRAAAGAPDAAILITGCYSDYDRNRLIKILKDLGIAPKRFIIAGHHDDTVVSAMRLLQTGPDGNANLTQSLPHQPQGLANALRNEVLMSAFTQAHVADDNPPADIPNTAITAKRRIAVQKNVPSVRRVGHIEHFPGRQRAIVKVQDGCDAFCSYCIVPFTRPRVWSRHVDEIIDECRALIAGGHKEIILCGVFLGAYGRTTALRQHWDGRPSKLPELVRSVSAVEGLWRVRLSSLEPADVCDELLDAYANLPNVAPHFHLPLQSGSPEILRGMNRQYTVDQYRCTIERIRAALDRPAITTDIIVGFPGENQEDFQATLDLAAEAGFAKIHAFPFSPIKGTAAWHRRRNAPAPPVVKDRLARLSNLEAEMARAYRESFVGEVMEAVVERPRPGKEKTRRAMTDRYQAVTFDSNDRPADELTGTIVRLRISGVRKDGLAGELVEVC